MYDKLLAPKWLQGWILIRDLAWHTNGQVYMKSAAEAHSFPFNPQSRSTFYLLHSRWCGPPLKRWDVDTIAVILSPDPASADKPGLSPVTTDLRQ